MAHADDPRTTAGTPDHLAMAGLDDLAGVPVHDASGEEVGEVGDVYVDRDGRARYVTVASADATSHTVLPLEGARLTGTGPGRRLEVPYAAHRVRSAPSYVREHGIGPEAEQDVHDHFGRAGWWEAVERRQTTPSPTPEVARADLAEHQLEADIAGDEATLQMTPAPTPRIAAAEVEDALAHGEWPAGARVRRFGP